MHLTQVGSKVLDTSQPEPNHFVTFYNLELPQKVAYHLFLAGHERMVIPRDYHKIISPR